MDCETCYLNDMVWVRDGDNDAKACVCPECGRKVVQGPPYSPPPPRKWVQQPPLDRPLLLADFDREAYEELEGLLRDGVVRERPPEFPRGRSLTNDDRLRLLEQLPGLVPVYKCTCGDAVCLTYDFVPRSNEAWRCVIEFDVPGIAVLELDEDDCIIAFEIITNTAKLT
jgi:hypothetical protein